VGGRLTHFQPVGIAGFRRWISKRYPLVSQVVQPPQVPEVDKLFIDLTFLLKRSVERARLHSTQISLTEEQLTREVLAEFERLVTVTRPVKVLFAAVDGEPLLFSKHSKIWLNI
jgi:5'-3' exonuclease